MMASNAVQLQHHHQVMTTHTLEEALPCAKQQPEQQQERRARPQPEQALRCPRCDSTNTKFCYYNNYSLSQPRYFCKGCRRYWTQGGTLRNVPVGGGCRKNKRSSSSSAAAAAFKRFHDHPTPSPAAAPTTAASPLPFDPADLALAFTRHDPFLAPLQASSSFLDVLRTGFLENAYGGLAYDLGPFQSGDHAAAAAMAAGDAMVKQEPCLQWQQSGDGGLFLDYWGTGAIGGGGAASAAMAPWHGLVNSSLI